MLSLAQSNFKLKIHTEATHTLIWLRVFVRLQCFDRVREALVAFVEHETQSRHGVRALDEKTRRGGVRDEAGCFLLEHAVVDRREADDAADVVVFESSGLREVGVGDLAVEGNFGGDVVLVDGVEACCIQLRDV